MSADSLVENGTGTRAWYAIRTDPRSFAIFDVLADDEGLEAQPSGKFGVALMMEKAFEPLAEEHQDRQTRPRGRNLP